MSGSTFRRQDQVDAFLPPFEPVQHARSGRGPLTRSVPWSGPRPSPRCVTSPTTSSWRRWTSSLAERGKEFAEVFGRASGGLMTVLPIDEGAETIVFTWARSTEPSKPVVDRGCDAAERHSIGSPSAFAPSALPAGRAARCLREGAKRVVVWSRRAWRPGLGGVLASNVRMALHGHEGLPVPHRDRPGSGGRPITHAESLRRMYSGGRARRPGPDLHLSRHRPLGRGGACEMERLRSRRPANPARRAENILKRALSLAVRRSI